MGSVKIGLVMALDIGSLLQLQVDVTISAHCVLVLPGRYPLQWLKAALDRAVQASSHSHFVAVRDIK